MATVPRYEEVAAPKAMPTVRQESVASPAMFAEASGGLARASQGLSNLGESISAIGAKMAEQEDIAAVLAVETARKEAWISYDVDARQNRLGEKAYGLAGEVKSWWDEAARVDAAALKNDRQRAVYKRRMSPNALHALNSMSGFEAEQRGAAFKQSADASKVAAINAAAADPTPENIAIQRDAILRTNSALALRQGWAAGKDGKPGVLDVVNGQDLTRMHKQVLEGLIERDKGAAAEYFAKYENEIDGSERDKLGGAARKATSEQRGREAAGEIVSTLGFEAGVDKLIEEARKRFGNDTFAFDAARADIKDRVSVFEHAQKTRADDTAAAVNRAAMAGATVSQIRGMPEFSRLLAMGPQGTATAMKIIEHQEAIAATRASRDASLAVRADANESRRQRQLSREGLDTYLTYIGDPEKLATLRPEQVINLRTTIGDSNTENLMRMHAQLTKSAEARAAAMLDKTTFEAMAERAGLDPKKKSPSEDDKARLVLLHDNVNMRLAVAAQRAGRPLTNEERRTEAQKAFDDTVLRPGFFGSTRMPVGALLPEELNKAVVTFPRQGRMPERTVKLSEIPPEYREELDRVRAAAGRTAPLTQEQLARQWLNDKDKWRSKK